MDTPSFKFSVDSFEIKRVRSQHKDTDYLSLSVAVAGRPTHQATRRIGHIGTGHHATDMSLVVPVGEHETAVFSYAIVNSGHTKPDAVEKQLQNTVTTLAETGAKVAATAAGTAIGAALGASIGTAVVPIAGTALGAVAGWLVTSVGGALFANCDGPVAAGVHMFTGAQLRAETGGGRHLGSTVHHPGTHSPTGCGRKSEYDVTWSVHEGDFHHATAAKPAAHKVPAHAGH